MEPIDLSLIEIGGSDDSLIEEDLNLKSGRSDDLLNVVDAGAIHFECSPLQTLGFKRSSVRRLVPAIAMSNVNGEISASVEEVDDKENLNERNLSVEKSKQETKRRKKVRGYNLRKSLAWNSAFFTEEGVLDSSELSTLCDTSIRESKTNILSSISEETSAPLSKNGDIHSGGSGTIGNSFSGSHVRSSNEDRKLGSALSRKAGTASQKTAASTPSKVQMAKGSRITSNGGGCPKPSASSSQKKPLNSNLSSMPVVNSRLPKPPLPKSESSSASSIKYAGTGARGLSCNLNIPSGSVQKNVVLKGRNSTKVAPGIVSSSSKSAFPRSGKNLARIGKDIGKSSLPAPVPTNSKLSLASKCNNIAEKKVLNPVLPGDKPAPRNDTCLCGVVEPPAPTNNDRAQFQPAKPTGLRMPSPSLGFFDQKKASASPIIHSPRGAPSSNLGEHNNPTFQKLNTPSHNGETKRATTGTMRLPREGTDSTKHRAVTSGSTSKDQIPFNITSPSNLVIKSNLEPNNLLTKLRSDLNPSTNNQIHTQQGSQVIQDNSVGLDEKQMEVTNPAWDELDHISKDENKLPEKNGNKVLAQSGSSLQDQNNAHLEISEVTHSQGSSSTRNDSKFLRAECQVNSEMPVKRVDNLLGQKNEEYTVIESMSDDNHDDISSTEFKDDAGVKDALVVHCGFSEVGLNGDRQSPGAETRELNLHGVNKTKHEQKVSDVPSQINSQMHASGAGNLMESDSEIGIQTETGFLICNSVGNEDVLSDHPTNAINHAGPKAVVPGDNCWRVSCDTDGESEQQAELRNHQNESEKILFEDSHENQNASLSIKQKRSVEGSLKETQIGDLISTQEDREARGRLTQDSDVLALSDPVVQLKESYREHSGVDTRMEALQFNSLYYHLSDENHDINFDKKHRDEKISSSTPSDSLKAAKDVGEEHIETSFDEVERTLSKCDPELQTHNKIFLNEGISSEQCTHEDNGNLSFIQSSTSELPKDISLVNTTNSTSKRLDSSVPSLDDPAAHLHMEETRLNSSSNNPPVENQESIDGKLSERPLSENYEVESSLRPIKGQIAADNRSEENHMLTKIVGSGISPSCKNSNGSSMEGNCSKLIHKRKSLDGLMPNARAMKPKLNDLPCDELLAALEEAEGEKRAPASPKIHSPRDTDSCNLEAGIDSMKCGDVASGSISKCPMPSNMTSLSHVVTNSNLEPNNLLIKLKSDSNPSTSDDQTLTQQGSQVIQDDSGGLDEKQMEIRSPTWDGFDHMFHDEKGLAEKNSVQRRTSQDQSNTHLETSEEVHSQAISSDQTESEFLRAECQWNSEIQVKRVDNSIGSRNGEDTVIESLSVDNHDSILEISQDGDRQSGQAESKEITVHDVNEAKREQSVSQCPSHMSSEMHASKAGKETHLRAGIEIGFLTRNAVDNSDEVSELHFRDAVNCIGSEILVSDGNCSRGSCDTDGEYEQQAELRNPHDVSEKVLFEDCYEEQNESVSVKQKGPIRPFDGSWKERDLGNLISTQEDRDARGRLMQSSDVSALSSPALQLKESDSGEHGRIEGNQMEALQFNSFNAHDEKLNSSVSNASLGVAVDADEQGAQQSEPINTSFVEVERILRECDPELQKHDKILLNDGRYPEEAQEDNGKSFYIQSSTSEQLPKDNNLENGTNSSSERRVSSAACEDDSVPHPHNVDMLQNSSNNLSIENHESTNDKLFGHPLSENYEAESSFRLRLDQVAAGKITGSDLSPSSKSSNSGSPTQGHCSKSINKRKSLDDVKPDVRAMKPKLNAVPFSDEWLAALEAAGEDILTMKSGAVQNSPPEKSTSEPNPWSPVKRKNNDEIGPFHCTKYTTHLQPPPPPPHQ